MNVVFILSDQHNPFFSGCYGSPVTRTPNMDAMAKRGSALRERLVLLAAVRAHAGRAVDRALRA